MENVLTPARAELAAALAAQGIRAYTNPPEVPLVEDDGGELIPDDQALPYPLCYVVPSEPYLDWTVEGLMSGEALMRVNVSCIAANSGDRDVEAEQLDAQLLEVFGALWNVDDWTVRQILQPGRVVLNNVQHLACAIEVVRTVRIVPEGF